MNKQDLLKTLEEWKEFRKSKNHELQYYQLAEVIHLVKQLDEPQKVKVPALMKEYLDFCNKNEQNGVEAYHGLFNICSSWPKDDILKWSFENPYRFINAFQYGYEVEEKPRYRVNIGGLYLKEPLGDTNDFTIRMTWNEDYAYPFDSWNMAREHTSELGGTIEKV